MYFQKIQTTLLEQYYQTALTFIFTHIYLLSHSHSHSSSSFSSSLKKITWIKLISVNYYMLLLFDVFF